MVGLIYWLYFKNKLEIKVTKEIILGYCNLENPMFLLQKHKNTLLLFFSFLLITYFIGVRVFFLMHQFSHQHYSHLPTQQKVAENKIVVEKKSYNKSEDEDD